MINGGVGGGDGGCTTVFLLYGDLYFPTITGFRVNRNALAGINHLIKYDTIDLSNFWSVKLYFHTRSKMVFQVFWLQTVGTSAHAFRLTDERETIPHSASLFEPRTSWCLLNSVYYNQYASSECAHGTASRSLGNRWASVSIRIHWK